MKQADISKLGKYEIEGELGKGAMGVVYRGKDPFIERFVALKTVRTDMLKADDPEATTAQITRFKREAQAAGRLNHPNIVGIYEYGEDGPTAFIAMEFIEGRDLKDYFDKNERFDVKTIVRIMGDVLSALDYAHHHGIVHRDIEQLEQLRFDVIVFDETQVVKNLKAATSNAVRRLKAVFVLALTGTPVENHLGEYYAIMDLCLPGLLGSREEFARQIGQGGQAGINRLIRRTKPFILRRSKQMIAAELPPKIETDIHLELSPKQKLLYQRTVEEVRGLVRDAFARHLPGQARIIALTAILRLRQICLAPSLAAPGSSDSSPKLDFLAEQLLELRDEGHSALVFSQFTSYLDIIEKGLKHHGLNYVRLDGSTPVAQRKNLVNSFQNSSEPAVFLISLKAGGKGLNLTRATYVFHMDPWWNPAVENQASDRAHRIGQTEQVTITRLIMRHTIEEKMMVLKEQKLKLYKAILEEGEGGAGAGLTREDFEYLLG